MNNAERDYQKSTTWTLEIPSFVQPKIVSKLCKALALAEQVTSQTVFCFGVKHFNFYTQGQQLWLLGLGAEELFVRHGPGSTIELAWRHFWFWIVLNDKHVSKIFKAAVAFRSHLTYSCMTLLHLQPEAMHSEHWTSWRSRAQLQLCFRRRSSLSEYLIFENPTSDRPKSTWWSWWMECQSAPHGEQRLIILCLQLRTCLSWTHQVSELLAAVVSLSAGKPQKPRKPLHLQWWPPMMAEAVARWLLTWVPSMIEWLQQSICLDFAILQSAVGMWFFILGSEICHAL